MLKLLNYLLSPFLSRKSLLKSEVFIKNQNCKMFPNYIDFVGHTTKEIYIYIKNISK